MGRTVSCPSAVTESREQGAKDRGQRSEKSELLADILRITDNN
jgi:hypothetical protein